MSSRRSRENDDADDHAKKKKSKQKEFAWMDSEDEDENDKDEKKAKSSDSDESGGEWRGPPPPSSATEVQSLPQMMRMMESWQKQRGKIRRLPMAELAAVCLAAARVRYYDSTSFGEVTAAVKSHLRSRAAMKAEDIAGVITGLADVNAYDKELWELSATALSRNRGSLERPVRKRILDAFKKVNHQSENRFIQDLGDQEAVARYEAACEEVAAVWQKPGANVQTWRR